MSVAALSRRLARTEAVLRLAAALSPPSAPPPPPSGPWPRPGTTAPHEGPQAPRRPEVEAPPAQPPLPIREPR